jgi:DNA-directed RNA polymerase specialized sigma24 family protein
MTQPQGLDAKRRHYFPMIKEKCTCILSSAGDAQDVAQETFLRSAVAWIYETATHLAIDNLRGKKACFCKSVECLKILNSRYGTKLANPISDESSDEESSASRGRLVECIRQITPARTGEWEADMRQLRLAERQALDLEGNQK